MSQNTKPISQSTLRHPFHNTSSLVVGVSKKTEKLKKQKKKPNREKKPIKILEKPVGSVWFRFYKPKTEKTELN